MTARGCAGRIMRNRNDQLAKQIGRAALGRSGVTVVHAEISPEPQHADLRHEPDPRRSAERARLGLLGRLATGVCLIEIYSHAPTAEEFRACLAKHIAFWRQHMRKARAKRRKQTRKSRKSSAPGAVEPFLWIIAAGAPTTLLATLKPASLPDWPTGVYFFCADVLRVGIIVASELPRDRSTVLVRLMAAGPLLKGAVDDLGRLSPGGYERAVAGQVLLDLQHLIERAPSRTPDEEEIMVTIRGGFDYERREGRKEGRTETQADAVLAVLRVRGIAVPAAARKRIRAEKDLKQLKRWHEKAIVASSIEDVIGDEAAAGRARRARVRA